MLELNRKGMHYDVIAFQIWFCLILCMEREREKADGKENGLLGNCGRVQGVREVVHGNGLGFRGGGGGVRRQLKPNKCSAHEKARGKAKKPEAAT